MLASAPTAKVSSIGGGFGLASAISNASNNLAAATPRMDPYAYAYGSQSGSACRRAQSASSAMDGPFKFFAPPQRTDSWMQRSAAPNGHWIGLPPVAPSMMGLPPTSRVAPSMPAIAPLQPVHSLDELAREAVATRKANEWFALQSAPTEPWQSETNSFASMSSMEFMETRPRLPSSAYQTPTTTSSLGDSPSRGHMAAAKCVVTQPNPPPVRPAWEVDAAPPRLLGRGMNGAVPRQGGVPNVSMQADKNAKTLAPCPNETHPYEPMPKAHMQEPAQKTHAQEPMLNSHMEEPMHKTQLKEPLMHHGGLHEMEDLRLRLDDAQSQLNQERSNTRKLEQDMERVQTLLSSMPVAEAEQHELAATKSRLERVEALAEEESCRLREECNSATTAVETLQRRLSDVEADHKRFAEDNVLLQRRLEDHKAHLDHNSQRCLEIEEFAKVQEPPPPPAYSLDAAAYEERLSGHEQHLKTHSDQLMESEQVLKDLQDKLKSAEADRDGERQRSEGLLQRQQELVQNLQASQRSCGAGATPIHQYKDFKTVRGFRFKVQGEAHKIEVAHHKGRFQLALDGETVSTLSHKVFGTIFKKDEKRMDCKVTAPDGERLDCVVRMDWKQRQWDYTCSVNHTKVPHCWERLTSKGSGHYVMDACWEPPEVAGAPAHSDPSSTTAER